MISNALHYQPGTWGALYLLRQTPVPVTFHGEKLFYLYFSLDGNPKKNNVYSDLAGQSCFLYYLVVIFELFPFLLLYYKFLSINDIQGTVCEFFPSNFSVCLFSDYKC